jgi:RimJ/RimL family protein N-acetyltransferase
MPSDSPVTTRPATAADSRRLFDWRNDPLTRAMSRGPDPVAWEVHEIWFAEALADPDRDILIGLAEGAEIGMVRFDLDAEWSDETGREAEISINLAPSARGRGLAAPLLAAAIRAFNHNRRCEIRAEIRADNLPSRRAFEAAGFRLAGEADGLCRYYHGGR